MKQSCIKCGYKMLHLHSECPMCEGCSDCNKKLHSCNCYEGE